jgi:hypothetical protein
MKPSGDDVTALLRAWTAGDTKPANPAGMTVERLPTIWLRDGLSLR